MKNILVLQIYRMKDQIYNLLNCIYRQILNQRVLGHGIAGFGRDLCGKMLNFSVTADVIKYL